MYIVYQTTNLINGKIYVGIHNNTNAQYLGSGKRLNDAITHYGKDAFKRETLFECISLDEAKSLEAKIVDESFILRSDTYNLALGGGVPPNWGSTGRRPDASIRMKNNNPVHNPEVLQKLKNNVSVVDLNGNTFSIKKDDPRYVSGELVSVNKNKITVKDKHGNVFHTTKDDPRYVSGELIHVTKNLKLICPHCKKEGGNSMKRWHFDNCRGI